MTTTLRLYGKSPYITPIDQLLVEYAQVADLSLPKSIYISRGGVCGNTPQQSAAKYIPDFLEDRALLNQFEQIEGRVVDFGTFHRRVNRLGWKMLDAATRPLQARENLSKREGRPKGKVRLDYEHAPSVPAVSYRTYYQRVTVLKWDTDRALYTPAIY